MKYMTMEDAKDKRWSLVYCNKQGEETSEDIAKEIGNNHYLYQFIGKFYKEEHSHAGCPKIENDDNLFILRDSYGSTRLWQVGGRASDMTGAIIPHTYKVREIGVMFD